MKNKKIVTLTIILVILTIVILLTISYAAFRKVGDNGPRTVKIDKLEVDYIDGDMINSENLYPIRKSDIEQKATVINFNVENKEDISYYYDINLSNVTIPLAIADKNMKWRLIEEDVVVNEGNFHEINENYDLRKSIEIHPGEIKKYKLMIWLENDRDINQSYTQNKTMSAKLKISVKNNLASSNKDEVIVLKNTTNNTIKDLKIYGNTNENGSVGDSGKINITIFQNMIYNGLGEDGDINNFDGQKLVYSEDKYRSFGSFSVTDSKYYGYIYENENHIPIDTNKTYYLNVCAKTNGTGARNVSGVDEFDKSKNRLNDEHVLYKSNTVTYLTQDLKKGDTQVHLNDVSNFASNTALGLAFWNYTDKRGYQFPELTYTRNTFSKIYTYENVDKENNIITLKSAWSKTEFKAGTTVTQLSAAGGTYIYNLYDRKDIPTDFKCYNKIMSGVIDNSKSRVSSKFSPGAEYIKWVALNNLTSKENSTIYYTRVIIRENENIQNIEIDITGHEPLRSNEDTRDYIDYKNSRIVRLINSDGSIKDKAEYEDITLPEIKTYEYNTIIESEDTVSPLFHANY